MSFDVAILEEAAIIPQSVMEAFAPILGVNNSVFIAITTATEDDNYISQMFSNSDEMSKRLFTRMQVRAPSAAGCAPQALDNLSDSRCCSCGVVWCAVGGGVVPALQGARHFGARVHAPQPQCAHAAAVEGVAEQ